VVVLISANICENTFKISHSETRVNLLHLVERFVAGLHILRGLKNFFYWPETLSAKLTKIAPFDVAPLLTVYQRRKHLKLRLLQAK